MQKITPFLWFSDQAEEAVSFYTSVFKNSKIGDTARYDSASAKASGRPEGSVLTVSFTLEGQEFGALNGGPIFTFTPAISLYVGCDSEEEIDELWAKFSEGGKVLMELGVYPFSKRYGWIQDKYGVSWQLNLDSLKQKIIPCLLFVGEQYNQAQEAMDYYVSIFKDSEITRVTKYESGEGESEGAIKYAAFKLFGQEFAAMDSGRKHPFTFTPAISFVVNCETQEEVDEYWEKLSALGVPNQCGWLADRYGISWQIVPKILGELLSDPDTAKAQRVMQAMLRMHKIDIGLLKEAYEG